MARKTQGVYDLAQDVLSTFSPQYGEDITEDVCVAIEENPDWYRRYDGLCGELSKWVVNNWIGIYTKEITGLRTLRQVDARRSTIITSYSKLG